jgi:nucleoside-diphosphate-sugar epimerase
MRQDSPLIGNSFIKEAAMGNAIKAMKSISVFRDFMYITDLIKQLIFIGFKGTRISNLNLGTDNIFQVAEFGQLIADLCDVDFYPGDAASPTDNYFGCLHNLKNILGDNGCEFMPLEKSVKRTLSYYRV